MATYKENRVFRMNESGIEMAKDCINHLIEDLRWFKTKRYYDPDSLESIMKSRLEEYKHFIGSNYTETSDREDGEFVLSCDSNFADALCGFFQKWIVCEDYEINPSVMYDILLCRIEEVPVKNVGDLALTMDILAMRGLIDERWIAITATNGLFVSKKGKYIDSKYISNVLARVKAKRPPKVENHERTKNAYKKIAQMQEELKAICDSILNPV